MKLRTVLYGLTLMTGCLVWASCVNDEEGPCLPDGKTQVLFKLELQDNTKATATTRAGDETWDNYDPKETGVAYDNHIDLDKVQLLLFNASTGSFEGDLRDLTYSQTGDNIYQYIGIAPSDLAAGEYKFVILANCDEVTGVANITDLNGKTFHLFAAADNTAYIPMWGVLQADLTLVAGNRQDIGNISLLRAMSKVTVKFDENADADNALKGYSLQKVTVSHYNTSGYIAPIGADTAKKTGELNLDASLHAYATLATGKEFTAEEGTNELTFYLAEYDNSTNPASLTVTLTKQDGETTKTFEAPIQFCEYVDGAPAADATPYNIVRNHWYQFNIYKVTERSLYVQPMVLPWDMGDEFTYKTDVSASYTTGQQYLRWDTDGNLDSWSGSYVAVTHEWDDQSQVPGRTPLIILTTTSSETMYLQLDNEHFELVKQTANGSFEELGAGNRLEIPSGANVKTNFFVRPTSAYDTATQPLPSREAHMSLVSNGPAPAKVPLRGSMPGFAEGVDEIWFYWVGPSDYKAYPDGSGPDGASSEFVNN